LTALAIFWLSFLITRNTWLSAAAVLTVVAGGALISGIGVIGEFSEGGAAYPYLPFLRRHIPSMSFPFLFALFGCLWNGLHAERSGKMLRWALLSAGCFAVLMFSYFYLWTTAASVMLVLSIVVLSGPGENRMRSFKFFASFGIAVLPFAVMYLLLIAGRSSTIDRTQLLVLTRQLDLYRNIEIIGIVLGIASGAILIAKFRKVTWFEGSFVAAFSLMPLVVFNQQVLSGRSLQPFHYEYYSANYVVVLAAILLFALAVRELASRWTPIIVGLSVVVIAGSAGWGIFETVQTTKLWDDINVVRDEAMPVNLRLRQLDLADGPTPTNITFNTEPLQADSQPSVAPTAVLWARHQSAFAGLTDQEENRIRYYKLLYYSEFDGKWLRRALEGCSNIEACMALFGWDRFNSTLSANARPLTREEVEQEIRNYENFSRSFDAAHAFEPKLDYLVTLTNDTTRFNRLAEWYEIGEPEIHGIYQISKLTAK